MWCGGLVSFLQSVCSWMAGVACSFLMVADAAMWVKRRLLKPGGPRSDLSLIGKDPLKSVVLVPEV